MKKRQVVIQRNGSSRASSTSMVRIVRYAECQKNHAANIGGYAVDGCREFMASGEEGTAAALTCAACGCHRNFHRREVETEAFYCNNALVEFEAQLTATYTSSVPWLCDLPQWPTQGLGPWDCNEDNPSTGLDRHSGKQGTYHSFRWAQIAKPHQRVIARLHLMGEGQLFGWIYIKRCH